MCFVKNAIFRLRAPNLSIKKSERIRSGHRSFECKTTKPCRQCGIKGHHQSICDRKCDQKVNRENEKEEATPITESKTENTKSTTAASTTFKGKGTVLLETAKAVATNEDGTRSTNVRILPDNGSQRSYVTNSLNSRLKLKPCRTETLHLNTFGEQKYRKQTCDVVKIRLSKPGCEEVEVSALSFPAICSSLPSKIEVCQFPHLKCLELADDVTEENSDSIDILIGSDQYWNIVTGEIVHGDSGPTAISSKLGWLLSGPCGETSTTNTTVSHLIIAGECNFNDKNEHDELVNTLKEFWETKAIGIKSQSTCKESLGDVFLKDLNYDGNHYSVGLPWKEERE